MTGEIYLAKIKLDRNDLAIARLSKRESDDENEAPFHLKFLLKDKTLQKDEVNDNNSR